LEVHFCFAPGLAARHYCRSRFASAVNARLHNSVGRPEFAIFTLTNNPGKRKAKTAPAPGTLGAIVMGLPTKLKPTNWYRWEVVFSIKLLNGFVSNTEDQIKLSWADFEKNRVTELLPEDDEYFQSVTTHKGLDSLTWDLETIFKEHFPNIQRRAALITLFSYLENELDKLCVLFQETEKYSINLNDISGKGAERSTLYLEKVCGLSNCKKIKQWSLIKDIQKIRNIITHNNGKLTDLNGKKRENEIKIISNSKYLSGETEVLILETYLPYVLHTFDNYFSELDKEINSRRGKNNST
jgi:hypothetical protein